MEKEELPFEGISVYATPRRLAVLFHQLAKGKPAQNIEKKGPPIEQAYSAEGQLKPAGEGFFRSLAFRLPH